jgi:phage terminase large subunit
MSTTVRRWALEPWRFVRDAFGVEPDAWQDDALRLIAKPETRRLALKACKGPGKTAVLAWIILWFLVTRWEAKVGATSITEGNIDANLWPELSKWMGRSGFVSESFVWTRTHIARRARPENWFAVKRTWPKSGNPDEQSNALAGLHADHIMFVLAVMVTAEAVLAGEGTEGKVVQSGNPTHTTGPLYRACTVDKALWEVITITGDPDNPKRSPRISLKWAREEIKKYGRDNPWVMVNVLGEFPPSSINALLGVEEVERAMTRHLRPQEYEWSQKRLGVDVARFGDDRTVIFPRQGLASFRPYIMRHARTTDIAARVMISTRRWGAELVLVDDTGHWGHGVIDNCIVAGLPVNPRYKNRRAEFWLKGADAIKNGGALPPLPDMVGELTEPTYTFLNGVFVLEDKDQIKERIGRSPDLADAYMQTYAIEDMPSELMSKLRGRTSAKRDGDPYALPRDNQEERVQGHVEHEFDPYE